MIEKLNPWVEGKRVLILGFGREGRSTWKVLKQLGTCACLDLADQREIPFEEGMERRISGPDYQSVLNDYDVVFKSPGIVLERPAGSWTARSFPRPRCFSAFSGIRSSGLQAQRGKALSPR